MGEKNRKDEKVVNKKPKPPKPDIKLKSYVELGED